MSMEMSAACKRRHGKIVRLRAGCVRRRQRPVSAFDGTRTRNDRKALSANGRSWSLETDDVFSLLDVATDQFVRFADSDEFLHAWHFFQRSRLHFTTVAGNADRRALRAGHGVGSVTRGSRFSRTPPGSVLRSECLHDD